MTRREYKGSAQPAILTAALAGTTTALTLTCSDLTGWPTGAGARPFYIVVDRGLATEEKMLCSSRSGNVLTVFDDGVSNGRAADGTAITAHSVNATVEHVFTATDADEANAHVNATAAVHGVADFTLLATSASVAAAVEAHRAATTAVHGIADTAALAKTADVVGKVNGAVATAATTLTVVRNITLATTDPVGGADGDVWLKYV